VSSTARRVIDGQRVIVTTGGGVLERVIDGQSTPATGALGHGHFRSVLYTSATEEGGAARLLPRVKPFVASVLRLRAAKTVSTRVA